MSGKAILQLARRIIELRAELDRVEKEWEALFPGEEDDPEPDTLSARILDVLARSGKAMRAEAVMEGMPDANIQSVRVALRRLSKRGKILRHKRGAYQTKPVEIPDFPMRTLPVAANGVLVDRDTGATVYNLSAFVGGDLEQR